MTTTINTKLNRQINMVNTKFGSIFSSFQSTWTLFGILLPLPLIRGLGGSKGGELENE
jgi:hypothetical protein